MRILTVLSISLVLAACGGDSGGGGAAGSYTMDMDKVRPEFEKGMAKMLEMMPAAGREKQMEKMLADVNFTATLKSDGTFVVVKPDGSTKASGTWKLDGSAISFVTIMQDGKKQDPPETITGTYDGSSFRIKPDEKMPFDLVFKKK